MIGFAARWASRSRRPPRFGFGVCFGVIYILCMMPFVR